MMRSFFISPLGDTKSDLQPHEFIELLQIQDGLLWIDFEATLPENDEPILLDVFGFHPLAVDDALQESHVPKLDDWEEYLYIVLHAVVFERLDDDHVDTLEVDIFVGKNFLVTHHDQNIAAIDQVWSICQRDQRLVKNGPGYLLYRLADEIVASYMPVVEALDEEIDQAEDLIFNNPSHHILEKIFRLKRAVLHLRRIIGPQREVLNKLARDEYPVLGSQHRMYFRDIYDHLVRSYEITESIRDLVSGTLDTYLSVINNRMNDIMKTLTVITTLFMPISFLTGFMGMNFFEPAFDLYAWTGKIAFAAVLAIFILTPVGMFAWMHKRGWM